MFNCFFQRKGHATFNNYSVDDELEAYNRQGMVGNTWTSEEVYQVYGKQKVCHGMAQIGNILHRVMTLMSMLNIRNIWDTQGYFIKVGRMM